MLVDDFVFQLPPAGGIGTSAGAVGAGGAGGIGAGAFAELLEELALS